jgi:hypothetical protein
MEQSFHPPLAAAERAALRAGAPRSGARPGGIGIQPPFLSRLLTTPSVDRDLPWLGLFAKGHLECEDSIQQGREGLCPVETGG